MVGNPYQSPEIRFVEPKRTEQPAVQPRRWYQVTVARLLMASAWMTVFFALISISSWWKAPDHNPPLLFAWTAAVLLIPFIAAGSLFGHPYRGLMVGVVLVGSMGIVFYLGVNAGWINLGL
jgi:hypothetical protein